MKKEENETALSINIKALTIVTIIVVIFTVFLEFIA